MYDGNVQQLGHAQRKIYDSPANLFVATFMGFARDERASHAAVSERNGAVHAITDRVPMGSERALRIEECARRLPRLYRDRPVTLGIRPEAITDPEGADRNARNTPAACELFVGVTEPAGSDTFVTMTLSGKDCIARMRADADVHPGQSFDFPP